MVRERVEVVGSDVVDTRVVVVVAKERREMEKARSTYKLSLSPLCP